MSFGEFKVESASPPQRDEEVTGCQPNVVVFGICTGGLKASQGALRVRVIKIQCAQELAPQSVPELTRAV